MALALVLGVLVTYLALSAPTTQTPAVPVAAGPALLAVPATDVTHLELTDASGRLSLVRSPNGWHDAADRTLPSGVVTDLLDALTTLRPITMVDDAPSDIADYGLGADATRLHLVGSTDRPLLDLEIGARNPAWTGLYARRDGAPGVFLVGALLQWEIDKLRNTARAQSSP
ncbi:MAG TPA: DUF4340 domain-containing protein [Candidatus Binatia bacterium]|nr:DUF4340 domain-containing protein [Candidatus Binatia bacterium]